MELSFSDKRFCVYIYRRLSDNKVIYIGNGSYDRPYVLSGRSKEIQDAFFNGNAEVEVIFEFLTKREAEIIEGEFLDEYVGVEKDCFSLLNKSKKALTRMLKYSEFSEYFYYDETSPTALRWKVSRKGTGKALIVKAGDVAGTTITKQGSKSKQYSSVCLDYIRYTTHRIVYCLYNKCNLEHDQIIDHIDGNHLNNNASNLRAVTMQDNALNTNRCAKQSNNISGVQGVSLNISESSGRTYYLAQLIYRDNYKRVKKTKYFRIEKYGEQEAFRLACEARKQFEAERDLALSMQSN